MCSYGRTELNSQKIVTKSKLSVYQITPPPPLLYPLARAYMAVYWPGSSHRREAATAIAVITSAFFEIQ
jgi:hypothetical protein